MSLRCIYAKKSYQRILYFLSFILMILLLKKMLPDNNSVKMELPVDAALITAVPTKENSNNHVPLQRDLDKLNENYNKMDKKMTCLNTLKTDCYPHMRSWFERLVERKAPANDEELVQFARQLIDPPSSHVMRKLPWGPRSTPQSLYVDQLLNHKVEGFFIEAGAQDGERASNTVWLEVERNWTGILVEIDPWFYTQMRGKIRHSYTVNACLSPSNYITELLFEESSGGLGKLITEKDLGRTQNTLKFPCLPVETLLLAVNRTTVDYFSLDIEGMEYAVLQTIPFSKYDIKTWSVEYSHTNAVGVKNYLTSHGYSFMKQMNVYDSKISLVVEDYIFKKKEI